MGKRVKKNTTRTRSVKVKEKQVTQTCDISCLVKHCLTPLKNEKKKKKKNEKKNTSNLYPYKDRINE